MTGKPGTAAMFSPTGGLRGSLQLPADKSISHRAVIIAAACDGPVKINNFLRAADTLATLRAITACGVAVVDSAGGELVIEGMGLRGLREPAGSIDVGNSGTTIRLLPGLLAGQSGSYTLDGDASIRLRPMDRIVEPLARMGVAITARDGRYAPIQVRGGKVRAIEYAMPIASAQVKSAILIAGLFADGTTVVREPALCRDHTEIMLANAGAHVEKQGLKTLVKPAERLKLGAIDVPADFSSAAFFLVAATIIPGSELRLLGVGVNETRTGLLDILMDMGADINVEDMRLQGGEPVADLAVRSARLEGVTVGSEISGRTIDELPLVALAGAFASGHTIVSGAAELKVKESDRIAGLVANLSAVGVDITANEDGFSVRGGSGVRGGAIDSFGDHRQAMLGAIAGLASRDGVEVSAFDCASVSFPDFREKLSEITGGGD